MMMRMVITWLHQIPQLQSDVSLINSTDNGFFFNADGATKIRLSNYWDRGRSEKWWKPTINSAGIAVRSKLSAPSKNIAMRRESNCESCPPYPRTTSQIGINAFTCATVSTIAITFALLPIFWVRVSLIF